MKKTKKKSCPAAYMLLTCQNFRPRYTANKKETLNKRKKKITIKNYKDYLTSYFQR